MSTVYLGESVLLGTTHELLVSFSRADEQSLAQITFPHPLASWHPCGQQQCWGSCLSLLKSHLEVGVLITWAHSLCHSHPTKAPGMGPPLSSASSLIFRTNRGPKSWLRLDTVSERTFIKMWDTYNHHTAAHTASAILLYWQKHKKTSTCLETGVESAVKRSQGGVLSLSLWISSLRLSGEDQVEEAPYLDILKDKGRSEQWGSAINGTGSPWEFSFSHCAGQIYNPEPAQLVSPGGHTEPLIPTPPSLSFGMHSRSPGHTQGF